MQKLQSCCKRGAIEISDERAPLIQQRLDDLIEIQKFRTPTIDEINSSDFTWEALSPWVQNSLFNVA